MIFVVNRNKNRDLEKFNLVKKKKTAAAGAVILLTINARLKVYARSRYGIQEGNKL